MRRLSLLLVVLGSFQAMAAQDLAGRDLAGVSVIRSLKDTQGCLSLQAVELAEDLDGEFFSERQVRFLKISFQNQHGQENVMYSKGEIKIEHSGSLGKQQESISFALDQRREARGFVRDGSKAELIHDGKGKLVDFRVFTTNAFMGSKPASEWTSICEKRR